MKLINITPYNKRRIRNMVIDLLPEFGYVRVTNRGLVVLKKTWWSIKRTVVNVTDLCIDILPNRLAASCKRKGYGDTYERMFSNDIYIMMQLKSYKKDFDILNYIWDKFNTLHRAIPVVTLTTETRSLRSGYLPVLSFVSTKYIPGVEKLLKNMHKTKRTENVIFRVIKLQTKALREASSRFIINVQEYAAA
jgi:hypothetical protein